VWIEEFGREDLIAWANEYWIAQAQPNTELWAHEFSKHATCFSTFDVPCYGPKYVQHEEIIDYFDTVVKYFMQVPTYEWLEKENIVPSNSTSYSLSDFQGVLTEAYGTLPYVGCSGPRYNETASGKGSSDNGRTSLSEVWYFSHVSARSSFGRITLTRSSQQTLGRPQDHTGSDIAKVNSTTKSNCATTEGGVWYYERSSGSERS
jgi:ribonuclease T2